ncbi:Fanconi anemia core complex-associated protein 100 [Echeneis naucrates]|uniref:Fanconi anemia core complex-associated protein 100 n=1 Tax=Echeneis naucrates TaxID=173247 RepID=UPI001113FB1E|nr:Fanconi anemia core complex-associated protein 100 [Echeneis naucrates]
MEGRCAVETWAEFGFSGSSCTAKIKSGAESDVFFCTGTEEVYVFNTQERKLAAILQLPGPVTDLVESHDKQFLYVSCTEGVYCVSKPSVLSRSASSSGDASLAPAELKISSECLVVGEEGVLSLLLLGSVLLLLSQRDTFWILSLYKTTKQAHCGSYEKVSAFSLPAVSAVVQGDTEGRTGVRRRPVLICVHSGDTNASYSSCTSLSEAISSDTHFCLEPLLFKLLFGIDAALAKLPVILCGLPDGRLCFLPMHLPGSRLRVLHSLEQTVMFVGASVVMEMGAGHSQCLVALGEQGRLVLIKTVSGGAEEGCYTAGFIEGCVPGPVVCGLLDKQHLYYSTGADLLSLYLPAGLSWTEDQDRDEETSSKTLAVVQSVSSLNVCRVIALAAPAHRSASDVELLGLSVRGQIQRISFPVETEDTGVPKLPSIHVGCSVRDLLSSIGDVCERASELKAAIKSKNQILKRLNQVLNISFLLIPSANTEEHLSVSEKQIKCSAMIEWSRLLQRDSLNLMCVLHNSSPYTFEQGWTLSITVFPFPHSLTNAGGENSSTSFSFPFHDLQPGETLEVSLPLAAAGDTSFPMRVSCSLIFSLSSLLGEEAALHFSASQSSFISLPLNTLTVDWLHALRLNSPNKKNATSQSNSIPAECIQAFLRSHRTHGCVGRAGAGGESASKAEQERYSASVRVSSHLLRDTLVLKCSDSDPQGPKVAPQNLCLSLLHWLWSEGAGGVMMGHQREKMALSHSVINARGPNGDIVKLTAKEENVREESTGKEESLSAIEVRIESSSLAAVCGLHHAVLHRIQALLHNAPESATSTLQLQSLGLRQAVQRAERLLQEIRQSRLSGAFDVGVSTGQMTRSLLNVYTELRENPLLII